jgi:hypothetical protein
VLTIAKCTTIMIAELPVTSGLESSLDSMVCVWNGLVMVYGIVFVEGVSSFVPLSGSHFMLYFNST